MIDKNLIRDAVRHKVKVQGVDAKVIIAETGLTRDELVRFVNGKADANLYRDIPIKLYKWLGEDDEKIRRLARIHRMNLVGVAICKLLETCTDEEQVDDVHGYLIDYLDEVRTSVNKF